MRVTLALLVFLFVAAVVFVWFRSQSSDAQSALLVPPIRESSNRSEAGVANADNQSVNAERMTRADATTATTAMPKPAEPDAPAAPSAGAPLAQVLDSNGAPVVLTSTPGAEDDVDFVKKYGNAGEGERHQALEDLRRFAESVANGQQGNVTPEAMSQLKREMSWLEAHGGS